MFFKVLMSTLFPCTNIKYANYVLYTKYNLILMVSYVINTLCVYCLQIKYTLCKYVYLNIGECLITHTFKTSISNR